MEVKEAVIRAKGALLELMGEEGLSNIGLEEVAFDPQSGTWNVTLGFSRPWNNTRTAVSVLSGEVSLKRTMRIVGIDDNTGELVSLKKPPLLVE